MTAERLIAVARAYGCEAGVCPFSAVEEELLPCRAVNRLPQAAKTVLCVLFPYRFPGDPPQNLSRYAAVADYHTAAGAVLAHIAQELRIADPEGCYEPFMDNSPLPEVRLAVAAGLGVRGDNGLFFSHTYGSFVFIGAVVTDREMSVKACPPAECLHCGACVAACPGGALAGDGTVDRRRCLSDITQRKGELTAEEQALLCRGGSAWGCDICQEVCPLNRQATVAPHVCFDGVQPVLRESDLESLTGKAYGWRGKAVLVRNLRLLEKSAE